MYKRFKLQKKFKNSKDLHDAIKLGLLKDPYG